MPVLDARALDNDPDGMALLAGVLRPGVPAEGGGKKPRKRIAPSRRRASFGQEPGGPAPLPQMTEAEPVLDPAG